jgi:heterodisulfide reductase subunit C
MVMDYVQASLRGDITSAAQLSFDCLSCGLCAVRCPAEIVPYTVGQLARRLYAKYIDGPSQHVLDRVKEVEEGKYDEEITKLMKASKEELAELYNNREIDLR